jgi:hypothetical protein
VQVGHDPVGRRERIREVLPSQVAR